MEKARRFSGEDKCIPVTGRSDPCSPLSDRPLSAPSRGCISDDGKVLHSARFPLDLQIFASSVPNSRLRVQVSMIANLDRQFLFHMTLPERQASHAL